jgi:hypothetical protein
MAHHPFCADESRMAVGVRIIAARLGLLLWARDNDEILAKVANSAAQKRKGRPPVRGRMLVLVTVGEAVEYGEQRSEGFACGGQESGIGRSCHDGGCAIITIGNKRF